MSTRPLNPRPAVERQRPWWGPLALMALVIVQSGCLRPATGLPLGGQAVASSYRYRPLGPPPGPRPPAPASEFEGANVCEVGFLEPRPGSTRPVPVSREEFQRTVHRLAREVRTGGMTTQEAARELLGLQVSPEEEAEVLRMVGWWELETWRGKGYGLLPVSQSGLVPLTPAAEAALREKYLRWCEPRGGGDCLGLFEDGPYLRTDDRRTLALAFAFGSVLDETREALARELLDYRALVALLLGAVGLYLALWLVPEPVTKVMAATLTVVLVAWLGLSTVWELMDGWAKMATRAHEATTFEELREAGAEYGKVLGTESARVMIMAVASLSGRTLGEVAAKVRLLPGYARAGVQWEAQGGAAALGGVEELAPVVAREGALATAVQAAEMVATSPQGPLAVVMLKKGGGGSGGASFGGRSVSTVLRHRGGNQQVELVNGERWHLPRGMSGADIPTHDKVGDMLQEAVTRAAREWGPHRLSPNEKQAINDAIKKGRYWLARLLEREARGRYVHKTVENQFRGMLKWNHQGVDVIDLRTGLKYELLSGTESNLARHGRRMASEFYRMITF